MIMFRKTWLVCMALVAGLTSGLTAGEIPEVFKPYFEEGKPVRAEIVTVAPPKEFGRFYPEAGGSCTEGSRVVQRAFQEDSCRLTYSRIPYAAWDDRGMSIITM